MNRRALMIGCDLISTVAVASMPVAAVFGALTITHIYLVGLITATVWVWFDASEFGALPALVGRARIVAAGSALSSAWGLIQVVASAAGGALAAVFGAAPVLWVDAASFLLSALALVRIPRAFETPSQSPGPLADPRNLACRLAADIAEGLRYVRRHPFIWPLTTAGFGQSLTMGAVMGLLVVYGVRQLGLSDTDARLAGCSLRARSAVSPPRCRCPGWPAGSARPGSACSDLARTCWSWSGWRSSPTCLWPWCCWWPASTQLLVIINGITLRQRLTPDRLQGRVNVTPRMIAWGGQPFGAAIGGALADRFPISTTYLLLTAGVATSAVLAWCSPLRSADKATVDQLARQAETPTDGLAEGTVANPP